MPQVQRSTSYRKPVPEYVPSPPSSPSVVLPPLNATLNLHKDVPPLPDHWQEIVAAKASNDDLAKSDTSPSKVQKIKQPTATSSSSVFEERDVIRMHKNDGSIVTLPGSQYYREKPQRRRGLPRDYRPPTPPLPSDGASHSCLHLPNRAITKRPDYRSDVYLSSTSYPSRHQSSNYLGIYAQSGGGISHTTFQTDKFTASSNPSLGWAHRLDFSSKTIGDDITIPDHASSTATCWKFGSSWMRWIGQLRKSFGRFKRNSSA